jgi:carbonic anhydrase/acetyltransferase-like protein (isoleucine patch superfamily)
MHALILTSSSPQACRDLARPIAGAPLLARQLEYLRANGVVHVVINRVADEAAPASLRGDSLNVGVAVTWIPSAEPLDRLELSRRAGLDGAPVVVLTHGRLGYADLREAIALARSSGDDVIVGAPPLTIEIWHPSETPRGRRVVAANGWMLDVVDEATAQALVEDVLLGSRAGIQVRGSEVAPGVWTSRGAVVSRGATVQAPCHFGADSFVADGAFVGPGAILGKASVVETGARVSHARVGDKVVVGKGMDLDRAYLVAGKVEPHAGVTITVHDALLVGARRTSTLPARLAAAAALGMVAPAALALGGNALTVARRLARVVSGNGVWLGTRGDDPDAAVLDLEQMLVPRDAPEEDRVAARALYRQTKSVSSDARLLLGRVMRRGDER